MATSEEVHEVLRGHAEFKGLLEKLDTPGPVEEFRAAIDVHGGSTSDVFDYELEELSHREAGLIRIAWEAHHTDDDRQKAETYQ